MSDIFTQTPMGLAVIPGVSGADYMTVMPVVQVPPSGQNGQQNITTPFGNGLPVPPGQTNTAPTHNDTGYVVLDWQFALEVSSQVSTAFDNTVYTTAFGDKPGTLQVSYLLNAEFCEASQSTQGSRSQGPSSPLATLDSFLTNYGTYRLKPGNEARFLQTTIGTTVFITYLLRVQASLKAADGVVGASATFVAWRQ